MRSKASRCAASAREVSVATSIPSLTKTPQARTRLPFTSTMQVSQVWMGPELFVIADLGKLQVRPVDRVDQTFA